ncbi:MAG: c-type cytochrome biogenesis protein CcmI [Gemmatimonadales bacterium]
MGFFIGATLLLLTSLALVAYPLLRNIDRRPQNRHQDNITVGRERLAELKRRKNEGEISEAEYAEQVKDLEAQLADDLHAQGNQGNHAETAGSQSGGQWVGIAVMAFIPIMSGLLYLTLGQPRALLEDARIASSQVAAGDEHEVDINAMVTRLAEKLKTNPDDPEGWFMLGRSYMVLNRHQEAADAFGRLRALVGDVPDVLVREADAMAMTQGGALAGEPKRLVERALQQNPNHPQALWMAATAAYQAGDYQTASDLYTKVEPLLEGPSQQQVKGMIQQLAQKGFGSDSTAVAAAQQSDESPVSLQVNVALDPTLQAKAAPQDTVFIFAKAVNGPPMPLAVVRRTVSDLPLTVTLDDTQAMTPQLKLSSFDKVTVGARISTTGNAITQPGDLQGESPPISNTTETIDVTIDKVAP